MKAPPTARAASQARRVVVRENGETQEAPKGQIDEDRCPRRAQGLESAPPRTTAIGFCHKTILAPDSRQLTSDSSPPARLHQDLQNSTIEGMTTMHFIKTTRRPATPSGSQLIVPHSNPRRKAAKQVGPAAVLVCTVVVAHVLCGNPTGTCAPRSLAMRPWTPPAHNVDLQTLNKLRARRERALPGMKTHRHTRALLAHTHKNPPWPPRREPMFGPTHRARVMHRVEARQICVGIRRLSKGLLSSRRRSRVRVAPK